MTIVFKVQKALAEAGHPLDGFTLAAAAGMPYKHLQKYATTLVRAGYVARVGREDGHDLFTLNAAQLDDFRLRAENAKRGISTRLYKKRPGVPPKPRQDTAMAQPLAQPSNDADTRARLVVRAANIPARLAFLRMLAEKTIFAEHAILQTIIDDYELALELQTADEPVMVRVKKA